MLAAQKDEAGLHHDVAWVVLGRRGPALKQALVLDQVPLPFRRNVLCHSIDPWRHIHAVAPSTPAILHGRRGVGKLAWRAHA